MAWYAASLYTQCVRGWHASAGVLYIIILYSLYRLFLYTLLFSPSPVPSASPASDQRQSAEALSQRLTHQRRGAERADPDPERTSHGPRHESHAPRPRAEDMAEDGALPHRTSPGPVRDTGDQRPGCARRVTEFEPSQPHQKQRSTSPFLFDLSCAISLFLGEAALNTHCCAQNMQMDHGRRCEECAA